MLYAMAKILVVDDEDTLTGLIEECLKSEGHEVRVCHDSTAAERIALEIKPDLALLDYQMPRKTGVQLLADLRARAETSRMPVLFMSGTQTVRFATQIPADPRVRFLTKPVDVNVLTNLVREMLDPDSWSSKA